MANTGKGFGKFLGGLISKKKPSSKGSSKYGSTGSDESDDEGYVDPASLHSTQPPDHSRGPIPEYPPPRPASPASRVSPKSQRPHSSIEGLSAKNPYLSNIVIPKTDYGKSLDSGNRKKVRPPEKLPYQPRTHDTANDDYLDPWDSHRSPTFSHPQRPSQPSHPVHPTRNASDDYANPFDAKYIEPKGDTANYIEPWDTRVEKPNTSPGVKCARTKTPGMKIPHKDDYSDPWDSKLQPSLPMSSLDEDDDYSTPYDAGKDGVFEKISQQRQSVQINGSKVQQDDIYDMPFDEQLAAAKFQSRRGPMAPIPKKQTSVELQESQEICQGSATYEDPWDCKPTAFKGIRPPATSPIRPQAQLPSRKTSNGVVPLPQPTGDDYDAPWEWTDNTVHNALTSRRISTPNIYNNSDGAPKRRSLTTSQIPQVPTLTVTPGSPKVYEIDPTIPLENQGWFHGPVKRTEAELLLRGKPDCSYLIRNSESKREDYSLSVKNNCEPMHLKITNKNGRFILGQNSQPYDTIPDMIHHYSMNKLNIKGAEHVKLIYPIIQEAMYFTVEPGT